MWILLYMDFFFKKLRNVTGRSVERLQNSHEIMKSWVTAVASLTRGWDLGWEISEVVFRCVAGIRAMKKSQNYGLGFSELEGIEKFSLTDEKTELKMVQGFGFCLGRWWYHQPDGVDMEQEAQGGSGWVHFWIFRIWNIYVTKISFFSFQEFENKTVRFWHRKQYLSTNTVSLWLQ